MIAKRTIRGRVRTVLLCDMCGRASEKRESRTYRRIFLCHDCEPHRKTYEHGATS